MFVAALMAGALGFAYALSFYSHAQWIAVWRGHQIRIRLHHQKVFFEVDGELVFEQNQGLIKRNFQSVWSHPSLGDTLVQVEKHTKGQDGVGVRLRIGDQIVPLFELPTKWYGGLDLSTVDDYWNQLKPVQFEDLGDPRWISACKILQLVRQSQMADTQIREAANILQKELRQNFELRLRLGEEAILALGESAELDALKERLETKIMDGLEAAKSLHMVTISLEAHADETAEMQRVNQILKRLQAEEGLERALRRSTEDGESDAERLKRIQNHLSSQRNL